MGRHGASFPSCRRFTETKRRGYGIVKIVPEIVRDGIRYFEITGLPRKTPPGNVPVYKYSPGNRALTKVFVLGLVQVAYCIFCGSCKRDDFNITANIEQCRRAGTARGLRPNTPNSSIGFNCIEAGDQAGCERKILPDTIFLSCAGVQSSGYRGLDTVGDRVGRRTSRKLALSPRQDKFKVHCNMYTVVVHVLRRSVCNISTVHRSIELLANHQTARACCSEMPVIGFSCKHESLAW